jgi:hypothetical protein
MNLILLPLDTALVMTAHYPTDQVARARNPEGQRGISCATMALALGQKTWANLRANFVHHDPTVEHNTRKIPEGVRKDSFTVDQLKQICPDAKGPTGSNDAAIHALARDSQHTYLWVTEVRTRPTS